MMTKESASEQTLFQEAVALERLKHRSYDLIVSGLRMPELDGPGLFESFERAEHPLRSRLVFVTGDTLGEEARTFLNKTRALSVDMPFVPAELKSVIKKAVLRPMVP